MSSEINHHLIAYIDCLEPGVRLTEYDNYGLSMSFQSMEEMVIWIDLKCIDRSEVYIKYIGTKKAKEHILKMRKDGLLNGFIFD